MDDSTQSIYMDMYLPKAETWTRVDMDLVRRDNGGRNRKGKVSEADLMTTVEEKTKK